MKKRHYTLLKLLALFCLSVTALQAQSLIGSNPPLPQLHARVLEWADYNGDGLPDLLMMGADSNGVDKTVLLRNTGTAFMAAAHPFPTLKEPAASWADIDNDGDPDLIVAGRQGQGGHCSLWINNGGTFSRQMDALPQVRAASLKWADLDGDGDQDCFLSGLDFNRGHVMTVLQNTAGHLSEVSSSGLQTAALIQTRVEIANISGGALPEIIVQGLDTGGVARTQMWFNQGGLSFAPSNLNAKGMYSGSIASADANNDGQNDLLFCGKAPRNYSQLLLGDTTASPSVATTTGIPPLSPGLMIWIDFNGDGLQDILMAGEISSGTIFRAMKAQAGLIYTDNQASNPLLALHNPMIAIADWNNDGYLDFALSGQDPTWKPVALLYYWDNLLQRFIP